ncbi:uncharacterized protein [Rutidosis leptorrhynchoides]|uniref:uncharacterized protein n=1 Tax=Rutidosis leptorrhynchoides TaxID=125765 RepID=UPI003A9A3B55
MQHPKTRGGTTSSLGKPKTTGANRDNGSSRSLSTRSPKAVDHRLQHGLSSEKRRVGRVAELESQLTRLQDELKKTKDQLSQSDSYTKRAHQEAEEAKKQLAATLAKLDESQQQLDELWASDESRIKELRKVSQDRDRAWESELKAVQKHLTAALNENQKLKIRLQEVNESKEANDEITRLRLELSKNVDVVQELKIQLNESKDSESRALELVSQTQEQLEMVTLNDENELGSALAANAELENELKRLKVQTEQWRKAAEVAAAIVLGDGENGKLVESSESLDHFHVIGDKSNSPYSEDVEDDISSKKTSNMLMKKLGVLLKKGPK